jgi:hypothetical protein
MLIFKALHILSMFGGVMFLVGEAFFYARAIWRGDLTGLAAVRRLAGDRPVIGASLFIAGVVFGLLTALTGGFDFLAGWLIAAYALVATLVVVNALPWVQRLPRLGTAAIEVETGQRPADEVLAAMLAIRTPTLVAVGLNVLLFAAIIGDMVLKPF